MGDWVNIREDETNQMPTRYLGFGKAFWMILKVKLRFTPLVAEMTKYEPFHEKRDVILLYKDISRQMSA